MFKIEQSKIIIFVESLFNIKIKTKYKRELFERINSIISLKVNEKLKEEGLDGLKYLLKEIKFNNYSGNIFHSISEEYLKENVSLELLNPIWYSFSEKKYHHEEELLFKATAYLQSLKKGYSFHFIKYLYYFSNKEEKDKLSIISQASMLLSQKKAASLYANIYISKVEIEESKIAFLEFLKLLREKIDLDKITNTILNERKWHGHVVVESLSHLSKIEKELTDSI